MSLVGYQRALADLIASPGLCLAVRANADSALAPYELSARERHRLVTVVAQHGMSTSCTLYRVNRMTPIYSYLPLTCFLLGDELIHQAEMFWSQGKPGDLQFGPEAERFAGFLRRGLESGGIEDLYLAEVLEFELATNRLHARARHSERAADKETSQAAEEPLVAIVEFGHDPLPLLEALADRRRPDPEPERGRFLVELDARGDRLQVRQLEPEGAYHEAPAKALAGPDAVVSASRRPTPSADATRRRPR
jgi:hypothetical protein